MNVNDFNFVSFLKHITSADSTIGRQGGKSRAQYEILKHIAKIIKKIRKARGGLQRKMQKWD